MCPQRSACEIWAVSPDEEIERIQATIKTLDAQKQRAMRPFTIAEADDADVKRELVRINKLHGQARAHIGRGRGLSVGQRSDNKAASIASSHEPLAGPVGPCTTSPGTRVNSPVL